MTRDYSHRLGKKKVKFVRKDGTPVTGKDIEVKMYCHEFLFGTGLFDVIPYVCGEMKPEEEEAFEKIFRKWIALFNNATFPFYWQRFEPERGKPRIEQTLKAAYWLKQQNVVIKGHPLCWHTLTAPWLNEMSNEQIVKEQVKRIHRDVKAFKGGIDIWDVVNEAVIMPVFDKYGNGITRICKEMGRVKLLKTMFEAAREENDSAELLINDFNLSSNYEILIDGCLNAGVPIDEIGLQTHQHQGYMGEERLLEILERYEQFQKPLHFTEITLTSGHIMPPHIMDLNDYKIDDWPTTPEFEDRQAREFTEMYEILFSHQLVRTAVSWNFVDGGWLNAPGGLLRKDGSVKPAYEALYELIHKKWWTDTKTATDENGEAVIEGYRGDYNLICCGNKVNLALRNREEKETEIFVI